MLLYFDTSAIVKLMRDEAETPALHRFMKSEPNIYFTCDLSRTEIGRVAIRQQLDPAIVAQTVGSSTSSHWTRKHTIRLLPCRIPSYVASTPYTWPRPSSWAAN